MKDDEIQDDYFESKFCWFVESLRIVGSLPDFQKQVMGALSYGCAWELRSDIQGDGGSLLDFYRDRLESTEIAAISMFLQRVSEIPENVFQPGSEGMLDPVWKDQRQYSIALLGDLRSRIESVYSGNDQDLDWYNDLVSRSS